jgi:hypothetical protein
LRLLRHIQVFDFAFVFETRSNLRLAPPFASLCNRPWPDADEAVLLAFHIRRLATVK